MLWTNFFQSGKWLMQLNSVGGVSSNSCDLCSCFVFSHVFAE